MSRILMLGLSEAFLRGVEGRVVAETFVAIEEPDIIRDRALASLPEELTCLAAILPACYQQAQEFLDVAVAAHAQWRFDAVLPGIEYGSCRLPWPRPGWDCRARPLMPHGSFRTSRAFAK